MAGRLNLCLIQTAPLDITIIENDQTRHTSISAVRDLLAADGVRHMAPALRELIPGNEPAVIVAPEYAFGSGDWNTLDDLVRQSPQPVVFIAGFGATAGKSALDWIASADAHGTRRDLSWDQAAHPIASGRLVNGAWCWLHGFNFETRCIVFLKNHFEQTTEVVNLPTLQPGRMLLHLQFTDADLFPMICADLVQPVAQGEGTAQARLEESLRPTRNQDRPVLILGSLLQTQFNVNWEIAIDAFLNAITVGRPTIVALANVANDAPVRDEAVDKWRTLTGVFGRFTDLPKNQSHLPAGRAIDARGIRGAVSRKTQPCAVAGQVAWPPYSPTGELFIWHTQMSCSMVAEGIQSPIVPPSPVVTSEVMRFIRRQPARNEWSPRVKLGLAGLMQHLSAGALPGAQRLLCTLLNGVSQDICADPDRLHDAPIEQALRNATHTLAMLKTSDGFGWQGEATRDGQLTLNEHNLHVLVWRDANRTSGQFLRELGAWKTRPGDHPNLVVFCEGPHGCPPEGAVTCERRDDITKGPSPNSNLNVGGNLLETEGDFTQPRGERQVACLRLERVMAVYTDYVPTEEQARLAKLMDQLTSAFGSAAVE